MITETKLDESFPVRVSQCCYVGGVVLYISEDVPSNLLSIENKIDAFFVEINLHKKNG